MKLVLIITTLLVASSAAYSGEISPELAREMEKITNTEAAIVKCDISKQDKSITFTNACKDVIKNAGSVLKALSDGTLSEEAENRLLGIK